MATKRNSLSTVEKSKTTFKSLPRELRDRIYQMILGSEGSFFSITNKPGYLHFRERKALQKSLVVFCEEASTSSIAREACQAFYRYNTLDYYASSNFLSALVRRDTFEFWDPRKILRSSGGRNARHKTISKLWTMPFNKMPWIRNLSIIVRDTAFETTELDVDNAMSAERLRLLLDLPSLRNLKVTLDTPFMTSEGTDVQFRLAVQQIEMITCVGYELKVHTNNGLKVVIDTWDSTSDLDCEEVSWMWDYPTEASRVRILEGTATHKEKINALMYDRWTQGDICLGAWAADWRLLHLTGSEQQVDKETCVWTERMG